MKRSNFGYNVNVSDIALLYSRNKIGSRTLNQAWYLNSKRNVTQNDVTVSYL